MKFDKESLKRLGIDGPAVRVLEKDGKICVGGRWVLLEEVSRVRLGDAFAYIVDTRPCRGALELARGAKMLLCESTYLDEERAMADEYRHMTALQAAQIAVDANVETLILTHFSARYRDPEMLAKEARTIFPNTYAAEDLRRFPFPK